LAFVFLGAKQRTSVNIRSAQFHASLTKETKTHVRLIQDHNISSKSTVPQKRRSDLRWPNTVFAGAFADVI